MKATRNLTQGGAAPKPVKRSIKTNVVSFPRASSAPVESAPLQGTRAHLISSLEGLLRQAKSGELQGLCWLTATDGPKNEVSVSGSWNDHLPYLAYALTTALNMLVVRMSKEGVRPVGGSQ